MSKWRKLLQVYDWETNVPRSITEITNDRPCKLRHRIFSTFSQRQICNKCGKVYHIRYKGKFNHRALIQHKRIHHAY